MDKGEQSWDLELQLPFPFDHYDIGITHQMRNQRHSLRDTSTASVHFGPIQPYGLPPLLLLTLLSIVVAG